MVYSIYRPWTQPRVTNIINNNIYPCCDNRSGGRMDNTGWYIFGGGVILSMLSGIFGGGRQQSYAPGWDYASHNRYQNPTRDKQTPDSLDLNSLKELYGDKWKIVERDGTFTAVHKETGEQKTADSYSNMLKELGGKSTSTTGQVTVNQGDPMTKELAEILIDAHGIEGKLSINDEGKLVYKDKDTGEDKTCELTEQNFGAILNAIKKDVTPKNDPTGDPDAEAIKDFNENPNLPEGASLKKNADGEYELTYTKNGQPTTKVLGSIADAYKELGLNPKGEKIVEGDGSGSGIKVPQGWERVTTNNERMQFDSKYVVNNNEIKTVNDIYSPTGDNKNHDGVDDIYTVLKWEVLNKTISETQPLTLDKAKKEELVKLIIKYNPSVFDENGKIKGEKLNFSKLDLPTVDWLKENGFTAAADNETVQTLKAPEKKEKEAEITLSSSNDKQKVIKCGNRTVVVKESSGKLSWDAHIIVDGKDFKVGDQCGRNDLDFSDFAFKDGKLCVTNNTYNTLVMRNQNGKGTYYLKRANDGSLSIKINNKYYPFEEVIKGNIKL